MDKPTKSMEEESSTSNSSQPLTPPQPVKRGSLVFGKDLPPYKPGMTIQSILDGEVIAEGIIP